MQKCYYVVSRILHFLFWTDKYTPAFIMLVLRRVNLINSNSNIIVIVIFKRGLIVIVKIIRFYSYYVSLITLLLFKITITKILLLQKS